MINVNQYEDYSVQIGKGAAGRAENARKGAVGRHQKAPRRSPISDESHFEAMEMVNTAQCF